MFDNSIQPIERDTRKAKPEAEPDAVAQTHNLYTQNKRSTRIYYEDFRQKKEVMRADDTKITTKLDDKQTVSAMLDLAETRGWTSVKLRGSESFKREAWVQAEQRGMKTEGYKPKETDTQEAQKRIAASAPVKQPEARQDKPETPKAQLTPKAKPTAPKTKQVWKDVETVGRDARKQETKPAILTNSVKEAA